MIQWITKTVNVADLQPFEKNPRKISADSFRRLKESLTQDGYHQRILATRDLRVIGGHQRIKALLEMGITKIEVLLPDADIDDAQFKRILVRDNVGFGEWDIEPLGELMGVGELIELGVEKDFTIQLGKKSKAGLTDDDAAPAVAEIPVSAPGDVWIMGAHRVMCGSWGRTG